MDIDYPGFGSVVVDGSRYDHDIVIEAGEVRARDKGPSKSLKGRYGHTPLSADEDIPWSGARLIIGSGFSGRLPVLAEIVDEATKRGVELVVTPTADACRLIGEVEPAEVYAVVHVTC